MLEEQHDLLIYHLRECDNRYKAIEHRLDRIERLIVKLLIAAVSTLAVVPIELFLHFGDR